MPAGPHQLWRDDEDAAVRRLYGSALGKIALLFILDRSALAIRKRAKRLGFAGRHGGDRHSVRVRL